MKELCDPLHFRVITMFLWYNTVRCWFSGNTIISIKSVFRDCQHDRIWEFGCGYNEASTSRGHCHWDHGYVNDPKKAIFFNCPNNGFIAGNSPALVLHADITMAQRAVWSQKLITTCNSYTKLIPQHFYRPVFARKNYFSSTWARIDKGSCRHESN